MFVPTEFIELIFPGTTKTSLPCSNAKSTVISVPLFSFASITIIPELIPLIILFLAGKVNLLGLVPQGYSEIIAPPNEIIFLDNSLFSLGYTISNPVPTTAIGFPLSLFMYSVKILFGRVDILSFIADKFPYM